MIKVGFIGAVSKDWMGGFNYYKNLLYAITTFENKKIEVTVFVGKNTDNEIKNMFRKYAIVIEDSIFDRKCLKWYIDQIEYKLFGRTFFLEKILKKYKIQVLSHSDMPSMGSVKMINWVPDFQHLHLSNMFSRKEIKYRNRSYMQLIKNSDCMILSSYDALKDFNSFAPEYSVKASVLQFVSQPDNRYFKLKEHEKKNLLQKYNIEEEFFYLPNQFWKHKNHMVVFEAVRLLVKENTDICVVCTGYMNDHRNLEYIEKIKKFVEMNDLDKNIKLLGLVDYEDVFRFMKFSKAVINPSLFEGWSSTVEECKSVGKNMILSDLNVHKEQYPEAMFFDKNSSESLKDILKKYKKLDDNKNAEYDLEIRTKKFADDYLNILEKVLHD